MSEDKKKPRDDLHDLIPHNAYIGIVAIANGGGIGMVGTSASPIIGIASSGGAAPAQPEQPPENSDKPDED
jgi:hypothetical protein